MFTDSDGMFAQQLMEEAIDFHPSKDARTWYIRERTKVTGGFDYDDSKIVPKISPLEDKEAMLHGQRIEVGDLKLTLDGSIEIDTDTILITEDAEGNTEEWNVYYVHAESYQGVVTERRLYVRPKGKKGSAE